MTALPHEPDHGNQLGGPGTATWLAERALLGILIRNPHHVATMRDWLHPHDFAEPTHQAIYATINRLHTTGELGNQPGADQVRTIDNAILRGRFGPPAPSSWHDLADLHHATATIPADRATRYARMVLESSIRRQLHAWAITSQPTTTPAEPLLDRVANLTAQYHRSTGLGADRLTTTTSSTDPVPIVAPPMKLAERAERQLIHAVIAGHSPELLTRFGPEDFVASTAHATTWHAVRALAHRGDPIDPVTVAWETEAHHDPDSTTTTLTPNELSSMTGPPIGNLDRAIDTVTRAALTHHTNQAQQAVLAATTNRKTELADLLTVANHAGTGLQQHHERLAGSVEPRSGIQAALDGERATPFHPPSPTSQRFGRSAS